MKRLNKSRLEYVIYHLYQFADFNQNLISSFRFTEDPKPVSKYIFFPLSDQDLNVNQIKWINGIPILFSCSRSEIIFRIENDNVIFEHDLLKSTFYLLTGYQEYHSGIQDQYGRFPYKESLQYKLDIANKPVINYYFEWILQGIEQFCKINHIPFKRNSVFPHAAFMLSHDVDRVNAYHFFEVIYKFKQLLGFAKSPYTPSTTLKITLNYLYHFLNPFSKTNPFWNFDFLRAIEKENNLSSVFFFLEKDGLHKNSRYKFRKKKIRILIRDLIEDGCEVGLHGTIQSATNLQAMRKTLRNLQKVTPRKITGVRQHYLTFTIPKTMIIQEQAGLEYDTSLGFAEHEGFRNSFCHPFKLYDFENEKMIDVWEIPLIVMDGTLFYYKNMHYEGMINSVDLLIGEIKKFKGIFTLLWHNSHFDELEFPGITDFYKKLLKHITDRKPESLSGSEIISRMNNSFKGQPIPYPLPYSW